MKRVWIPWPEVPIGAAFRVRGYGIMPEYVRVSEVFCMWLPTYTEWAEELPGVLERFPTRDAYLAWLEKKPARGSTRLDELLSTPNLSLDVAVFSHIQDYPLPVHHKHPRPCTLLSPAEVEKVLAGLREEA